LSKDYAMITTMTRSGLLPALLLQRLTAAAAKLLTPAPKRPLTRAQEAEEVRALARSLQRHDRGFAADLFAAAARHEGLQ
jgi:hypothetical protein